MYKRQPAPELAFELLVEPAFGRPPETALGVPLGYGPSKVTVAPMVAVVVHSELELVTGLAVVVTCFFGTDEGLLATEELGTALSALGVCLALCLTAVEVLAPPLVAGIRTVYGSQVGSLCARRATSTGAAETSCTCVARSSATQTRPVRRVKEKLERLSAVMIFVQ